MNKIASFVFLILLLCSYVYGQEDDFYSSEDKTEKHEEKQERAIDKWSFGGNFWMGFGSSTFIELSPVALYKFHPRFLAGPGITYIYQSYRPLNISSSTYGVKAIASYSLFQNLNEKLHINVGNVILHAENEALNIELFDANYNSQGRMWIDNLLVGGGLFQPLGNRGGISVMLLFDVTQNEYSPYTNPILRLGFYF